MCNGIAVLVYLKNGELKGLCTGISSHDELCKQDEELRYGKIEPYRFELLYPCNLIFDRVYNMDKGVGVANEQPEQAIWDEAFRVAKPYFIKHTKEQLQYAHLTHANLTSADLRYANLTGADLTDADLTDADLTGANLTDADIRHVNLTDAVLTGAVLTGADLRYANLTGANLTDADLRYAYHTDTQKKQAEINEGRF